MPIITRLGPFGRLNFSEILIFSLLGTLAVGCAGPNTPLGAVEFSTPPAIPTASAAPPVGVEAQNFPVVPKIQFQPSRQVLHNDAPVDMIVEDLISRAPDPKRVIVRYNDLNVTRGFLQSARIERRPNRSQLYIHVPKVRLDPVKEHKIEVMYSNGLSSPVIAEFAPPECRAFQRMPIRNTGRFDPPASLVQRIRTSSSRSGLNPALFIGLVAQESSFNPHAVSRARAIGLTQMTPIAEKEILHKAGKWPRYPGLHRMSPRKIRQLIRRGEINPSTEWRVHTGYSVDGGLEYLKYLSEKWSSKKNLQMIRETFEDPETEHTRLILASYNSGYTNVRRALRRGKKDWMHDRDMREARIYVNRIFSFCYHFSENT